MMFPLLIHSVDMVVSSIGVLSIRVKKSGNVAPSRLDPSRPPTPCTRLQPLRTRACNPCVHALATPACTRLQVVLAGKKPSYYDLEGAAEEKLLEHYGGSGENTASGPRDARLAPDPDPEPQP